MIFAGHLLLDAEARPGGRTVLARQSFQAPYHISKPYWDGRTLMVQVVNPTAGILQGDTLQSEISVAKSASLLVTSPSASRVFRMNGGEARSRQRFVVKAGAWFEFWPEPLVPHDASSFHQSTEIETEEGAEFFIGDYLFPGRLARGEIWQWSRLCLELSLRSEGELILRERFDQSGERFLRLAALAGQAKGAAFGNILVGSAQLADDLAWRSEVSALQEGGRMIGVSRLRGKIPVYSIKYVVPDGDALRQVLRRVREILAPRLPHLACDPRKL